MSEDKFDDKFFEEDPQDEDLSLDSLIQSTKEEIENGAPTTFEPSLPPEYADLVNEDEEEEEEEEERQREELRWQQESQNSAPPRKKKKRKRKKKKTQASKNTGKP